MSESITHTAVVDDTLSIAGLYSEFCPEFKDATKNFLELARLGGITRHGDRHNPDLLERLRALHKGEGLDETAMRKLAFILGWLSHRAADRQFKRVFREVTVGPRQRPFECSVYHDVYIFRILYKGGQRLPYSPWLLEENLESHPAAPYVPLEDMEDLMKNMWAKMLIEMHTFIPDDDNIDSWLEKVTGVHQRLYVDMKRYSEAYLRPDPEKMERFIYGINFYDPEDQLLALTLKIRNGEEIGSLPDLEELTENAKQGSQYGQAVGRALRYVTGANKFFTGKIDKDQLLAELNIGRGELEKVE